MTTEGHGPVVNSTVTVTVTTEGHGGTVVNSTVGQYISRRFDCLSCVGASTCVVTALACLQQDCCALALVPLVSCNKCC
jgi:hypothetical protein